MDYFKRVLRGAHLVAHTRANYTMQNREVQVLTSPSLPIPGFNQSNKTGTMAPKPILAAVSY